MSVPPERDFPSLSGYEILDVIGEGGMGTVYRAHDLKHDRQVAIKTIRRDLVNPHVASRFEREIRLTSSLQHPRILPLLDSGFADGTLFYVMQFIEGESLQDRVAREGALPMDDALRIARHVADALDCAHSHGVVHRDIKPANILLSGGHALVMDFGIGRALAEGNTSLTSTGSAIGTPKYMSPEQVTDSTTVDGRSDTYSLGCVLYEMIAGHPPFTGRSADSILRQHLTADPPRLGIHRPGVPLEIEAIVERAMAKSPADRFQAAGELAGELERLSTRGIVVEARPSVIRSGLVVTAAYLLGAWAILAILDRVAASASLPDWTVPFAMVLLLVGLLVVGATAVIQATVGRRTSTTDPGTTGSGRGRPASKKKRLRSLFRWRNVATGGVLALALWGIVASIALFRQRGVPSGAEGTGGSDPELAAPPGGPGIGDAEAAAEQQRIGGDEPGANTPVDDTDGGPGSLTDDDAAASGDSRELAARGTAPPPPPSPPTAPVREEEDTGAAEAAVANAREQASTARTAAESAGVRIVPTPSLGRADSLWADAVRSQIAGRPADASGSFELARIAYGDAGREAGARVRLRLDSVWQRVDSLRTRADPSNPPFADGDSLREAGREAEARGDLVDALQSLGEASRHYSRALPFVELPPPYDDEGGDDEGGEADPPAPTPSERIAAVMATLESAFEAEDLVAIRRIWVDLSQRESESFRDFFENGRDPDYEYSVDAGSIESSGAEVAFGVTVQLSYREGGGDRVVRLPASELHFRLADLDGRDVLSRRP